MDQPVLFGRYRLVAPAGSGGTAQVWRALDERTGDEVAVKRLHPVVFGSDAGRQRLVREFRALRDLHHPNIVRVRDLEIGTDEAALILDFVDGQSLRERLGSGTALAPGEAVAIASDVGAALDAAHRAGLVHRDVSPGNVLIGMDGAARLTDFGIARAGTDHTAVTGSGLLVGTLHYVAPELLRGGSATASSDLYSLAAVTYEMLAGRPAFAVATPVALVEAQRAGAAPIENVDPALDAVVRHGLADDPTHRPATVAAFAAGLQAVVGHDTFGGEITERLALPLAAAAAGAAPVPSARVRNRRAPAMAAATLGLAALALAAAALSGPLGPEAAVGGGSAQPKRPAAPTDVQPTATPAPTATPLPATAPAVVQEPPPDNKGEGRGKNDGDHGNDDKGKKDEGD